MCLTMNCPSGKVCSMVNGPRCVDEGFECEGLLEFCSTLRTVMKKKGYIGRLYIGRHTQVDSRKHFMRN